MSWKDEGLCQGYHADPWFPPILPEDKQGHDAEYYAVAKAVCDWCFVSSQCLTLGFANDVEVGMRVGVWGGWTPEDRENGVQAGSSHYLHHPSDISKVIPMPNQPFDLFEALSKVPLAQ